MNKLNDGGPAFPYVETGDCGVRAGMTLRDYFAAKALPVVFSVKEMASGTSYSHELKRRAIQAYEIADTMLAARDPAPVQAPKAATDLLDILIRARDAIEALDGTTVENERPVDDYRAAIAKATGAAPHA